MNYYRLKQTDVDGKFWHSIVASVHIDRKNGLVVSPNPVSNQITLHLNSTSRTLKLSVITTDGRSVLSSVGSLAYLNKELNRQLYLFKGGTYIVQVIDGEEVYGSKIIWK
jgi:hypothetical protein